MTDPLDERARLEEQIAAAWGQYTRAAAERQEATVEVNQATRALEQMRKMRAVSRATDKEVNLAEKRLAGARHALAVSSERENGALDAAKASELDLEQLIQEHGAIFAEQAEAATQRAVQALAALWEAMRDAQEAWEAAGAAWAPVARAHRMRPVDQWPLAVPTGPLADLRAGTYVPRPREAVVA